MSCAIWCDSFSFTPGKDTMLEFSILSMLLVIINYSDYSTMQAKVKRNNHEPCSMVVFLDRVKDIDFYPLLDLLMEIDASEIDAVDIFNESSCVLNGEYALSLMRAINQKLRIVDLQDLSLGKDFLRYVVMFFMHYPQVFI